MQVFTIVPEHFCEAAYKSLRIISLCRDWE